MPSPRQSSAVSLARPIAQLPGLALAAMLALAGPAAAFSITFDLPRLTFPEGQTTTSTKGCVATLAPAAPCTPAK